MRPRRSSESSLADPLIQTPALYASGSSANGGRRHALSDDVLDSLPPRWDDAPDGADGDASGGDRAQRSQSTAKLIASLRDYFAGSWWSSGTTRFYAPASAKGQARLVQRDYPFHQSSGKLNMDFILPYEARRLFQYDLFHVLVQAPTMLLLLLVCGTYTLVVLIFACVYIVVDRTDASCHLGVDDAPITLHTAFAFAVETQSTVGYGIPSEGAAYFSGCPTLPIVVFLHALIVWILNAAMIGGTLARLSRANLRAVEVVFSDKATVQCIRGDFYLRFQVAELSYFRFHPAVEAHVRCYAVLHEGAVNARALDCPFQTRSMRLLHPDDTRGGMLFLPVPSAIMHAIDEWSPLWPPPLAQHRRRAEAKLDARSAEVRALHRYPHLTGYSFPGLQQRMADLETQDSVRAIAEAVAEQRAAGAASPPGSVARAVALAVGRQPSKGAAASAHQHGGALAAGLSGGGVDGAPSVVTAAPAATPERVLLRKGGAKDEQLHSSLQGVLTRAASQVALDGLGQIGGGAGAEPPPGGAREPGAQSTDGAHRFRELLRDHLARSDLEVVVLVEAIDPLTSNTFQARHSYKGAEIIYDHTFVPCISFDSKTGRAKFDMGKFHQVTPCEFNMREIGPTSSHA